MSNLLIIAGVLLLVGGVSQSWLTLGHYRTGRPWRGSAMLATAFTLYGVTLLLGVQSTWGAAVVWLFALKAWVGVWQQRQEQARQRR